MADEPVSRMRLIERWIVTSPPNPDEYTAGWEPKALNSERVAETYRRLGWQVVEVVPAEYLRGAVAADRHVIAATLAGNRIGAYRGSESDALTDADTIIAALRGQ